MHPCRSPHDTGPRPCTCAAPEPTVGRTRKLGSGTGKQYLKIWASPIMPKKRAGQNQEEYSTVNSEDGVKNTSNTAGPSFPRVGQDQTAKLDPPRPDILFLRLRPATWRFMRFLVP